MPKTKLSERKAASAAPRKQRVTRVSTKHAGKDPVTGQNIPHVYSKITERECVRLAKLGGTVDEIAVILNLRPGQVRQHYGAKVDRELALHTLEVETAMLLAAKGRFTHPDTHVSNYEGYITLTRLMRHYPPNQAAAQFWLKHRSPVSWPESAEGGSKDPDEVAAAVRERLRAMAGQGGVPAKDKR